MGYKYIYIYIIQPLLYLGHSITHTVRLCEQCSCPTRPLHRTPLLSMVNLRHQKSIIWEAMTGVEGLIVEVVAEGMDSLLFEVKRYKAFVRCSFTTGSCIFAACRRAKPTCFRMSAHAGGGTNHEIRNLFMQICSTLSPWICPTK